MSLTRNEPTRKSGRPPHVPFKLRSDVAPDALAGPRHHGGAGRGGAMSANNATDYRLATTVRREMYRRGWSIIPPRSPSWQRGRS